MLYVDVTCSIYSMTRYFQISLYDVYSGSVSVFFTHNGCLPPGTRTAPMHFSPRSYISPHFLLSRSPTDLPSSEPFSIMLQIFITMFAIPHAQAFERVASRDGHIKAFRDGHIVNVGQPSQSARPSCELPSRKWPFLEKYEDSVILQLNGWNPLMIPSSIKAMLHHIFPSLAEPASRTSSPTPTSSPPPIPHSSPQPQLSLHCQPSPHLHESLHNLTIADSGSSISTQSSSSSAGSSTIGRSSQLYRMQGQLENLESEQSQLQMAVRLLMERLQLANDEVAKCRRAIEDLQLQPPGDGKTSPNFHRLSSNHQPPVAPVIHSFGKRTAALFRKWQFGREADEMLYKITSYSQTEAEWRRYLSKSFNLPENELQQLFRAMRDNYITAELRHTSEEDLECESVSTCESNMGSMLKYR